MLNESTAADSVERKRALSERGLASLMQAARPSLQIEAVCVQICPMALALRAQCHKQQTSSLTRKLLATIAALGNEI
jgi:hypothetical protein